jgi:DNA-binding SARP family transcriptional activator
LGEANQSLLISERNGIALKGAAVDVDALKFEDLIEDGSATGLEQAAALYCGELLEGIDIQDLAFENWLRAERQRLHERACETLFRLLEQQATEDSERAIATARRLLSLDPLREATHRYLIRLYADNGERSLALKQYEACRDVLRAELGVESESETVPSQHLLGR